MLCVTQAVFLVQATEIQALFEALPIVMASVKCGKGKAAPRLARQEVLASPTGLEPVAPRLGIWCSIRLSYGDGSLCGAAAEAALPRAARTVWKPAGEADFQPKACPRKCFIWASKSHR